MKKKLLSLALALALCLGLTIPAFAKDLEEASEQDILSTFTIHRNNSVDEKEETYQLSVSAQVLNAMAEEETPGEKFYNAISKSDSWTITNTGNKDLAVSGNSDYEICVYLSVYHRNDGKYVCEYGKDWWGNKGHFVEGMLESGTDGSEIVSLKAGESTTIPASAFVLANDVGIGFGPLYELDISVFYRGNCDPSEDSYEGMKSYSFYFSLDENMKELFDTIRAPKNSFIDIKASDYFADAVQWAVEQDITSGTSKTTFSPNATCSKAQILTFLWRANGSPEPTAATPFTDVKTADYFYKAALWAAEKGLVSGSTFGANTDCTRAMTVEYMWKAAGSPAPAGKADFDDVPANADYAQAVAWAVENEITSGTGGGNFSPTATCTRGQIVTFLYRAMGK
ncbi:S-layer homology domain-containing protein [Flintibacter muris]|uniref:S-layer homology domain-containing protein n=1 Tax=Flintibacter muris TaxID=2941327 RepID=UPI00203D77F6|nr:S-layer homology domain-containing protein [Flintibacter muris]